MLEEKSYRENIDLGKDQFYELLASTGAAPQTSQPSPDLLFDQFKAAKLAGDEAVYISISSGISGTFQTARITLEDVECDDCYVVDSLNATAGERILVDYAVRLRDEGKNAKEIVEALEAIRSKVVLTACIDTLEYLYRGGRISQTVYKLGTMAQVKPIIRFSAEGTIEVPAKAMGMRKGMDQLCKRLEAQKPDMNHKIYVVYTADRAIGETLAQKVAAQGYEIPADQIVPVGAVIGSHIGPGGCGIIYIAE
jgi:DegV family protein with EDD domain